MKKLSIFKVCVPMQDQAQCDRMKAVCLDNGLQIWGVGYAFDFSNIEAIFGFDGTDFFILLDNNNMKHTQVTEAEFIELLKEYKSETKK